MPSSLAPLLVAAALTACTIQAPPTPDNSGSTLQTATPTATATPSTSPPTAPSTDFTDAGGGLSVRLDVPPGPHKFGTSVDIGLEFRNDTKDELRIYLLDPPIFRAMQSDLAIFTVDGKFVDSQPEPHPHGHVVSEGDFPAIAPGATRRFTQPLFLDPKIAENIPGDLQLRWTYRNKIDAWAGGAQTLDGTTKPLFGGGRIPGIWLGELTRSAPLPVTR